MSNLRTPVLLAILTLADLPAAAVPTSGVIAYPDRDSGRHQQIFTIRADGSGRRQLTFDGDSGLPSWSADGKRLVFTSIRADSHTLEVRPGAWVMNADGSDQRQILAETVAADLSPDGTRIAFVYAPGPGIWTANLDGSQLTQLSFPTRGASQIHPSWSWDGTRIAYVHVEPDPSSPKGFHPEIWVMNANGSDQHLLTVADPDNLDEESNVINTAHDANAPDWSPTDDRIAFWSGEEGANGQIWVINADGSGRTQLTEAPLPSHNDDPAWSADGESILFSTDRGGIHELWVMGADGAEERRIARATAVPLPGDAAWQPVPADGGGGGGGGSHCSATATALCLHRSRFEVRVVWEDFAGHAGGGQVVPYSTEDSGVFWFFGEKNWDLLVKVIDGCARNRRYWVFAAAANNVAYTLTVTDTVNGSRAVYKNPLGRSSPAIIDKTAFATCP